MTFKIFTEVGKIAHIFQPLFLHLIFCVYTSNVVENPIHLSVLCLTPAEQGCGELFSLDKNDGKLTGVPNHRVKNISLPFSQTAAALSLL